MFPVGFDVDGEVAVTLRIVEAIVPNESIDLRFGDRRDLALVGVERGEAFGKVALTAKFAEGADKVGGLRPGLDLVELPGSDA